MDLSYLAVQIAVVIGLNEAIKQAVLKEDQMKFIPLISIFMGVAVSLLLFSGGDLKQGILDGIITGLSSVGLFSVAKNVSGI